MKFRRRFCWLLKGRHLIGFKQGEKNMWEIIAIESGQVSLKIWQQKSSVNRWDTWAKIKDYYGIFRDMTF